MANIFGIKAYSELKEVQNVIEATDDIANRNWADLTDNFTYTSNKYVRKLQGSIIEYVTASGFSYSEQISVTAGDVYRTIDYTITSQGNWTANARGIFLGSNGSYVMDVPCADIHTVNNTFEIPVGVSKMIVNRKSTTRLFKVADFVNIFSPATSTYVLDNYVNNSGAVVSSASYGYVSVSVVEGEVYRIADVFGATGESIPRGAFLDSNGVFVKVVKYHQIDPLHWNDVIVPAGATVMKVNFLKALNGVADGLNRLSINKGISPTMVYKDNSKLKSKILCALGDSITWYGEWLKMISNATELTFYNHGYSSGSIAENGKGDDATYPVLCLDAKIEAIQADNPDIVTIMGGVNDKSYDIAIGATYADLYATMGTETKTTYIGAYSYIIKKLLTWKPTLKIIIMAPSGAGGDLPNGTTGLLNLDYAEASKKIAAYFGLQWVDVRGLMNLNLYTMKQYTRDNVHHSFKGADAIAQILEREIRNINWQVN